MICQKSTIFILNSQILLYRNCIRATIVVIYCVHLQVRVRNSFSTGRNDLEMTIDYAGTGSSQHFLNLTRFLGSFTIRCMCIQATVFR